jgi:hypothetical protein
MSQDQRRVYIHPRKWERDPGINSYPTRTLNNQSDETQMREWPDTTRTKEREKQSPHDTATPATATV